MQPLRAENRSLKNATRHSSRRAGWSSWLMIFGLFVVGVPLALWSQGASLWAKLTSRSTVPSFLTVEVTEGLFLHKVLERGELQSSSNVEVRCEVRSRTASGINILEIVPEGTWVRKGDFLVRFDDAGLQTELIQQQIVCSTSEALAIEAKADVEAAKLALKEYQEGTFRENEELLESQEFVAQENMRRAEEYLRYSERLAERGYITEVQLDADRFALEKARKELAVAGTKLDVLRSFTKAKMLNQMKAAIETATARLESRTKTWELDKVRLKETEEQIAKCVITAPTDGQVVYANDPERRSSGGELLVAEGRPVREKQVIIRLPDPGAMRVMVSVHESRINQVRPGLKAEIVLDAMPGQPLTGTVTHVSEYPLPSVSIYTAHVKQYAVEVKVDAPPSGLRPGMTAAVNMEVERISKAIQVPMQAVIGRGERYFCGVQKADGSLETREIKVGPSNEEHVVILDGLAPGEAVAMRNPELEKNLDLPSLPDSAAGDTPESEPQKPEVRATARQQQRKAKAERVRS